MRPFLPLLLMAAILALLLTACASQPQPESLSIKIEMSEYAFSPDIIEVKVGQEVTFELVNIGVLEHEIMIGREVMMDHNRPNGYMVDLFETAGVVPYMVGGSASHGDAHGGNHKGFMVTLSEGGDQATMSFPVTEKMVGDWEIGCFLLDGVHYDAGMIGKLIVSK